MVVENNQENPNQHSEQSNQPKVVELSELVTLQKNWKQILDELPDEVKRTMAASILRSGNTKPIQFDNGLVTIGCKFPIHASKLKEPELYKILEMILCSALSRPVKVKVIAGDFRTPAEKEHDERLERDREAKLILERKLQSEEDERNICVPLRAELKKEWIEGCGLAVRFHNKTFKVFDKDRQKDAYECAVRYAYDYKTRKLAEMPSLILYSDGYGTGKTHLVSAIALDIIHSWNEDPRNKPSCPLVFTTESELMIRIRSTYNKHEHYDAETEDDVYKELMYCKLLILDDVGKEQPSDARFCQRVYFNVINNRYNNLKPVVITSNLTPDKLAKHMGDAAADRLLEMCQGGKYIVKLNGKSYRAKDI